MITIGTAVFQFTLQKQSSAGGQGGRWGEQCGNAPGFADTILFLWHLQGWTSVAAALQNSPTMAKTQILSFTQAWPKVNKHMLKKKELRFVGKLGRTILRRGRSSRAELLVDTVLGACWQGPGPSLHTHQPEHPKIWAGYLNRLIWGPKNTSGSEIGTSGNVMQWNFFHPQMEIPNKIIYLITKPL